MIEVVLLSLAITYNTNGNVVGSRWEEVRHSFTTITECQYYVNSMNNPQSLNRLACIQRTQVASLK